MNRVKRLLVVLLATLTMVVGAFGVAYAANWYDVTHSSNHTGASVQAGDGTLTVSCEYNYPEGEDHHHYCEFYGGRTVTITPASNLFYNGEQKPVTVSSIPTGITKVSLYYKGTQADGTNYERSSAAPINAGTYTASLTLNVDGEGEQIITKNFTIQPKPIPRESLYWQKTQGGSDSDFNYEYDKQSHVPYAYVGSSVLVGSDTCSVTVTGEQTNAGEYTATATEVSNKNYKLPESPGNTQAFKILQKSVSFEWDPDGATQPGTTADPYVYEYDGNPHGPGLVEVSVSGIIDGDDCSVTVSDPNTDVGEYQASASLTGDSKANYKFEHLQVVYKFYKITKRPITVVWDNDPLTYNGEVQYPEVTLYHGQKEVTDANVTVTVYSDDVCQTEETVKTDVGKTYYAKITLSEGSNYAFADGVEIVHSFNNIQPYGIDVTWEPDPGENQKKITYDGVFHSPTAVVEDELFDVDSGKVKANVYIDGDTVQGERFTDEPGVVNTVDPETGAITTKCAPEIGVKDASSSNYRAKVEANSTEVTKGIVGPEAHNYVLKKNIYTYNFQIIQKKVSLEWFRPAYDEYGEVIKNEEGEVVYVKVTEGDLNLVFNGQPQAPVAKIAENSIIEGDTCKILVEKNENAVRKGSYTTGKLTLGNKNYSAEDEATPYNIVPRPARLHWDAYDATYNGKAQKRAAIIDNIATTEDGSKYSDKTFGVVEVSQYTYTDGKHFDADEPEYDASWYKNTANYNDAVDAGNIPEEATGSAIADDRTPIDAGVYNMTAAELSDEFNYTLFKLTPDVVNEDGEVVEDGGALPSDKRVDLYEAYYTIHQYGINKIDWRNTTVTYNASNQKPIAEVNKNDLQGPDTVKEVVVMIHDDLDSEADDFAGKCNANTYDIYVLKNDFFRGIKGDRSMNYFIGEEAQKMQEKFVINKKLLTVTVNNKTGYYGDDPATYKYSIKYAGLINGEVNTDDNHENKNIPGKYTDDEDVEKDVVDESGLKYTVNYAKWGKPGSYSIKASGLKSDNYDIKYVAGKLTIKDKTLAGDLLSKAKAGNKTGTISWTGISGAAKYQVYFSYCNYSGKKFTPKLYKTLASNKRSLKISKLKKKKYYKFYVVALDSKGKTIKRTETHHFCTNNVCGKYTNPKNIKASRAKVTIKKGQSFKVTGNVTKVKAKKKLTNGKHTEMVRFRSAVPQVATVGADGTIKGVSAGWCRVYVMAANGIWQTVEVTVK